VAYLIVGAPIMYLYLVSSGGLLARAARLAILRCCGDQSESTAAAARRRAARQQAAKKRARPASVKIVDSTAALNRRGERISMGQLAARGRSTWQRGVNSPANGSLCSLDASMDMRPRLALPTAAVCSALVSSYVILGATALCSAEDGSGWTFGEALYFCFVSLCTVGFGGLRPEDPNVIPCVVYLFGGLALMSACAQLAAAEMRQRSTSGGPAAAGGRGAARAGSIASSIDSYAGKE